MTFRFIEEHVGAFETARLCKVMDVSSSGQGAFRSRPASRRPRMTKELKKIVLNIGHRRVGRLIRPNGTSVVRTREHKVTTVARQAIAKQSA